MYMHTNTSIRALLLLYTDGDVKNEVASSRLVASLAALRMADKLRDTSTHKNNNKNNNIVERRQHFGGLRDCKGGMRGQLLAPAKQAASDDNGVLDFKARTQIMMGDSCKLQPGDMCEYSPAVN